LFLDAYTSHAFFIAQYFIYLTLLSFPSFSCTSVVRQARFDVVEPPPVYLTAGNEHLGKRVLRTFKGRGRGAERKVWGDVVGWLPAAGDDEALWRVRHSDGDEEDLDEGELTESLAAAEEEAAARKKVTEMEFDDEEDGDDDGPTVRTTRAALAAAAAADGDEDDDDAAGEPALVRRDKSLSLGAHGVKPTQLGLQGLRHELIRVQVRDGVGVLLVDDGEDCPSLSSPLSSHLRKGLLLDGLKRRGSAYAREGRKVWEQAVRDADTLPALRAALQVRPIYYTLPRPLSSPYLALI
jgi:hypothetical protein